MSVPAAVLGSRSGGDGGGVGVDCVNLSVDDEDLDLSAMESLAPIRKLLESGAVRLIRGDAVLRWAAERVPMPARQNMDEHDFCNPEELKWGKTYLNAMEYHGELHARADEYCSVLLVVVAVSYAWLSLVHPDPHCYHLARLAKVVAAIKCNYKNALVAVFWDFASLYQRRPLESLPAETTDKLGPKPWCKAQGQVDGRLVRVDDNGWRYQEEQDLFSQAISFMEIWYGHDLTLVVKFTDVPAEETRPYSIRGWTTFESSVADCKYGYVCEMGGLSLEADPDEVAKGMFHSCHALFRSSRKVPLLPEEFQKLLQGKNFTNQSDHDTVSRLYAKTFRIVTAKAVALDYSGAGLQDDDASQLALVVPHYRALTHLHLDGNNIKDCGAIALVGALQKFPQLVRVELQGNKIGDRGAIALAAALPNWPKLEELILTNNRIGFLGYFALLWGKGRRGELMVYVGEVMGPCTPCIGHLTSDDRCPIQRSVFGCMSLLVLWPIWMILWMLRLACSTLGRRRCCNRRAA